MSDKNLSLPNVAEIELSPFQGEIDALQKEADSIVISDERSFMDATNFLSKVNRLKKSIESKRVSITKPMLDWKRDIDSYFKSFSKPLQEIDTAKRQQMLSWRKEENARIAKEEARRQKIQKAHEEKGHNVNDKIELERTPQTLGKATAQKYWTFEVTDEKQIPREFLILNERAVKEHMKINQDKKPIPGIRIFQEERLSISSRY